MKHTSRALELAMAVGLMLSAPACTNTPAPLPSPITGTYVLAGAVFEVTTAGLTPLDGVQVYQQPSGKSVMTSADGTYRFTGLSGATSYVTASKAGFTPTMKTLTLTGDTQLDFDLRRIPSSNLSGVVFEMTAAGPVPIERVSVYCDGCGDPSGHTYSFTDADGLYSFDFTFDGPNPLLVSKDGYRVPGAQLTGSGSYRVVPMVSGNTRFDIELVRD